MTMVDVSPLIEVAEILYDFSRRILPEFLIKLTQPIASFFTLPDSVRQIMPDLFENFYDQIALSSPLELLFLSVVAVFILRPILRFIYDLIPFV